MEDFFDSYLHYTRKTEACSMYHRWAGISAVGALLGRNIKFEFGHFHLYPNMYMMMIGEPGSRKTTAINIAKKVVKATGYNYFAPNKTSKEKFMAKLARGMNKEADPMEDMLELNIFGQDKGANSKITECYICNDEFNNFIGIANLEFISLLGEFWDYDGVYENELKNSESDYIANPTISILGGNTHTNFATAFPATVLGQGFFSRLLLIYGEKTRPKLTVPPKPDEEETKDIVARLKQIREFQFGEVKLTPTAFKLVDKIYHTWRDLEDPRFVSYSNRRFTHFLKLCMIYAATRLSRSIDERDVIKANTVLSFTEQYMSKAMGEIGRNRHSETMQKVMTIINNSEGIVKFNDIWKHCTGDLEKISDLSTILSNLAAAGKIQSVRDSSGSTGLLPMKKAVSDQDSDLIDPSIISADERSMKR